MVSVAVVGTARLRAETANLADNPGFEEASAPGLPAGWGPLIIGAPATFGLDREGARGGTASARIDAGEITRSYFRSDPIAVAPMESFRISAWVRTRDVPPEKGTVIAIAEFSARPGAHAEVRKIGTAGREAGWQRLEGIVQAPAGATELRLRLGFSYSMGTCWWDDVHVEALSPLVARADIPEDRLYPAMESLAITVLNREGRRGEITIRAMLAKQHFTATATLSGEPRQTVPMPIRVRGRGKQELKLELVDGSAHNVLHSAEAVQVTIPPPLTLFPLVPTHWVREDGEARFEGQVEVALDRGSTSPPRATIQVLDRQGAVRATRDWPDVPIMGVAAFNVTASDLPAGDYLVRTTIERGQSPPITTEQPWHVIQRREARVTLNADGFPEADGRAMFPRGMFNNGGRLEESAKAGFNIVHAYNAARVRPGRRPDDQRLKDLLDRTHRAGMKCLLLVPMEYAIAGEWDAFRRRIRMFRNHPGLLAWDEEEGLARGDMKHETLAEIRRILREDDPHHPFMVGDARDVIGRVTDRSRFFPVELMDLGMWWWYPFPLKAGVGDDLQGEQADERIELTPPTFLTERTTDKPIWVGVQSYKKPTKDGRYPTPVEYRAQAYLAVMHGARGLMWYGGSVHGGLFLNPQEGHWEALKGLLGELRDLEGILLAPSAGRPAFAPTQAPISADLRRAGGRSVLMAVNRGPSAVEVIFSLPEARAGPVRVLGEDRSVVIQNGRLRDRFEPFGTHVYELSD